MKRRDFLKVLGTTGAGASLFGCSTEGAEKLIPYVVPAEEIVPGLSTWYRTTCRECPAGCGMNIRTREGRAIKAEGNPLSPISHGALCARGQASLHGLYNPDRVPQALAKTGDGWDQITWNTAQAMLAEALQAADPERTVFLTQNFTGTMDRLLDEFSDAFGIERVRYETFNWEPLRMANRLLFGIDGVPVHDFANAEVVVSFGADFIETWLSPVDYQHGFTQSHAFSGDGKGRFVTVTPHQSLTDMNADEWVPILPGTEHLVALAMARAIADRNPGAAGAAAGFLQSVDITAYAEAAGIQRERIVALADEFARRPSLAAGPGVQSTHEAATATAVAVALLNYVAGNVGTTVRFGRQELAAQTGSYRNMHALLERMKAGEVDALLVYGPNPLYSTPQPEEVVAALERVDFIASFDNMLTDTAQHADLLLPDHHFLESWGDYVPRTGVYSLIQPVMQPVFETKQTGDVLLAVAQRAGVSLPTEANSYYDYLRESWQRDIFPRVSGGEAFDDWWREALQLGTITTDAPEPTVTLRAGQLSRMRWDVPELAGTDEAEFALVVYPSYKYYDGRLANRPWLQELPDPVSKITWGSWVEVNPLVAEEMGLDNGSIVEVATPYGQAELPVWIHPRMRPDVIAIQLGQGHDEYGRYAEDRGVNPIRLLRPLVEEPSGSFVWLQTRAALRPTGEWTRLAQDSDAYSQEGRGIARATTLVEARELGHLEHDAPDTQAEAIVGVQHGQVEVGPHDEAGAGEEHGEREVHPSERVVPTLQEAGGFAPIPVDAGPADYPPPGTYYGEYSEEQPRWGMAIDLERCTGCSACVTACYAENNIGIVGPEQVQMGRHLHWLRIERYFDHAGEHNTPIQEMSGAVFAPMLCQHCGNAPCEPVCPVYASYHTPDGLNAQVYNRCVGTRYCANNCPYKVRYFNWYTWEWPEPLNWQLNPDVAVREKGVMEKCTFCVQRIREGQHEARLEGRGVPDGEIVPACAQTCPSDAIIFGNVDDENSRVARIAASGRGYRVFEALNTQSAITYLKKVVDDEPAEVGHA